MPVTLTCDNLPLAATDVARLWQATRRHTKQPDQPVAVTCVTKARMQELNREYRGRDYPTNVLTFNYPEATSVRAAAEHDVVLCLPVARAEADTRSTPLRDYIALLLVHAFLHALGFDHERSAADATATRRAEQEILSASGFAGLGL